MLKKYSSLNLSKYAIKHSLGDCFKNDILIENLTNKQFINFFEQNHSKLIVSCFSGYIEGDDATILSRVQSDLILFNCPNDYERYIELSKELAFSPDNAFCFGYPQLLNIKHNFVNKQKDIVFFEQLVAPRNFRERCYLLKKLVHLAKSKPQETILIKPRCKLGGRTIHKQIWHLERIRKLLKLKFPDNLRFTYEPVEEILQHTDLCITVSSTVAIEAMARGIPTAIVSDFGVRKDIHTASFVGSGCLATFDQLATGCVPSVNRQWLEKNVKTPDMEALKIKLNELLILKNKSLLPHRHMPDGAFSKVPDNRPLLLKRMKKLMSDPIGFCNDSRYKVLRNFATIIDSKTNRQGVSQ